MWHLIFLPALSQKYYFTTSANLFDKPLIKIHVGFTYKDFLLPILTLVYSVNLTSKYSLGKWSPVVLPELTRIYFLTPTIKLC